MKKQTLLTIPARLGMVLALLVTALGILPMPAAYAANYEVNSTDDNDDGTCNVTHCSLREAIKAASDGDTITFNSSVSGNIQLNSDLPTISDDVTITGPGADVLAVDGQDSHRPFTIVSGATVVISGLTITNGKAPTGGGVRNAGTLTLEECAVSGNTTKDGDPGGNGDPGDPGDPGSAGDPPRRRRR